MQSLKSKEFAPIYGDDKKVEVSFDEDQTTIKLFDWVDGLGWSCQKTIALEMHLVEDLHRALAAVRCRSKVNQSNDSESNIIEFPSIL